jgi:hypothetical protein
VPKIFIVAPTVFFSIVIKVFSVFIYEDFLNSQPVVVISL